MRCRCCQDFTDRLQGLRTTAIRLQSVVPDSHKPFRQDVHQEPSDKLTVIQRHDLLPEIPIVFVAESNLILLDVDQVLIADRDSVCVSGEISDHTIGAVQAVTAIHAPVFLH